MSNDRTIQQSLEKVTAFVTRDYRDTGEWELLVFRHPSGGVQLPAGTVEEGEAVEDAARREVEEETGLTAVTIVACLGNQVAPMRSDERVVLDRVSLLQRPIPESPEVVQPFPTYLGLRRGLFVRQIGEIQEGYAQVAYEEFDGPAHEAACPSRSVSGWIRSDVLSPLVVRHFFHLTTTGPTPDAWIQRAEEWDHPFELFWVPLLAARNSTVPGLIPSQAAWLVEYAHGIAL